MINLDPEGNELSALRQVAGDLARLRLLEVGCGDGRLTVRLAQQARRVLAIDPHAEKVQRARSLMPVSLRKRVAFQPFSLQDFYDAWLQAHCRRFDRVVLAWSL